MFRNYEVFVWIKSKHLHLKLIITIMNMRMKTNNTIDVFIKLI